jgi:CRP/FNR family cyclic AMP-dependent transcriptional regulator
VLPHEGAAKRRNQDDADDRAASFRRETHAPGSLSATKPDQRQRLGEFLGRALPDAANKTVETLVETARLRAVGPGDVAYRQGETIPFTLMIHGYAAIRRTTTDGRQFVFGIASPGWLVGHPGISGRAASTDLVAITPTEVARWSGTEVRALVLDDSGLAVSVIDALARFLGMTTERLDRFVHQEARGRVLRVLATYADLFFGEPPVLPRTLLPGLVGTSREMTGRVLRSLEAEGVISRAGRRGLRLLAPAALEQAADATDTSS